MEQAIIFPIFNIESNDKAVKIIEQAFPDKRIETIDANEIAQSGGVLNCISWNILT